MDPLRVGLIGTGNISGIYLENLTAFDGTTVLACADLDVDRAKTVADKYGVPLALSPEALLAHPDIELVVNLTIPAAHGKVAMQAVEAGKHVYNEKPLSVELADGIALVEAARAKGVRVGGAPETFMGAGQQLSRELIDQGLIGKPVGAQGFMLSGGVEMWHPNPEFYYKRGGGPMLDMGPYYVTAFVNLLGPISQVFGLTSIARPQRTITSQPFAGQVIDVDTPTHLVGVFNFENGAIGDLTTSFEIPVTPQLPSIAIYGTEGTLLVPDPNTFGGPVLSRVKGSEEWTEHEVKRPYAQNSRGLGVLDMGLAIRENRPHRASGDLAVHVLEVMHAVLTSSEQGRRLDLTTKVTQPEAMPSEAFGTPDLR